MQKTNLARQEDSPGQEIGTLLHFPQSDTFSFGPVHPGLRPKDLERVIQSIPDTTIWSELLPNQNAYVFRVNHHGTQMILRAPIDAASNQRYLLFTLKNFEDENPEYIRARIAFIKSQLEISRIDLYSFLPRVQIPLSYNTILGRLQYKP